MFSLLAFKGKTFNLLTSNIPVSMITSSFSSYFLKNALTVGTTLSSAVIRYGFLRLCLDISRVLKLSAMQSV